MSTASRSYQQHIQVAAILLEIGMVAYLVHGRNFEKTFVQPVRSLRAWKNSLLQAPETVTQLLQVPQHQLLIVDQLEGPAGRTLKGVVGDRNKGTIVVFEVSLVSHDLESILSLAADV